MLTLEAQTLARACGKAHLRHLEPEDLVALTVEAAAMARVPLAGTSLDPRERSVTDIRVDVAVVGAGLMGSATAWELTRRGVSVALIEQFEPGHTHGSSHGTERIVRRAYADPFYVRLTARAMDAWAQAEDDTGTALLRTTGGLDTGAARDPAGLAALLAAEGVAVRPARRRRRRTPAGPACGSTGPVLFHPQAGVVDADAARVRVVAPGGGAGRAGPGRAPGCSSVATDGRRRTGAHRRPDRRREHGRRRRRTRGSPSSPYSAPPLPCRRCASPSSRSSTSATAIPRRPGPPSCTRTELQIFGMPSGADGGPVPAFKIGQHDGGMPTTASTRDGVVDPACRERLVRHVTERLPGLHPEPVAEATCLYTTTPDDDFVLDRIGPVVSPHRARGTGRSSRRSSGR